MIILTISGKYDSPNMIILTIRGEYDSPNMIILSYHQGGV